MQWQLMNLGAKLTTLSRECMTCMHKCALHCICLHPAVKPNCFATSRDLTSILGLIVQASITGLLARPSEFMTGMDIRRLMKGLASASSRNTEIAEAVLYISPSSMEAVLPKLWAAMPALNTACTQYWAAVSCLDLMSCSKELLKAIVHCLHEHFTESTGKMRFAFA